MDLLKLRRERRAAFWGQVVPYLGYVFQSGVAVVFLFLLIAFSAWYTSFVQHLPANLPIRWIMLVLLALPIIFSTVRTYVQKADIIFLRPLEYHMRSYLQGAWISGVTYKMVGLLILLILLWPMYIRADADSKPLLLTAVILILIKLLCSYGGWQEQRMTLRATAAGYRLLRWAVGLLAIAAWLWQPPLRSLPFLVLLAAAYAAALRAPAKQPVPWENLIDTEKAQAGRVMRTLGWFVDVPALGQRVKNRRWLAGLGRNLPWERRAAYRYLLMKTFARTEAAGIIVRLVVLGLILTVLTASSWFGNVIYVFFVFLIGVQLATLRRPHAESFWLQLYPIPANMRRSQFLTFMFQIQLPVAILLFLPLLLGGTDRMGAAAASLIAAVLLVILFRQAQGKKWDREVNGEDYI
ncbi:ABC transporter permease [Paenibacillus sp. JX-17]|uniref:ABC transporter permease n=1 Tax=Paenibacillus lacisoli TaxID=3064525 RepID=A0ABT9CCM6_9BACL|nr:ABC transporter permease [Paenibacillus sp. JX-17]MDO7907023.1 ABC transporter permease [Paenibacillus sp. JX-17]